MVTGVIAYGLVVVFFVMEFRLRKGGSASSLDAGASDRGSTLLVVGSLVVAVDLPLLLNWLDIGRFRLDAVAWFGLCVMIAGMGVRVWAMRVLGSFYSRTLRVEDSQTVVTDGPYRLVRHPGYLGSLMFWFGSGLALHNWLSTLLVTAMMWGIYAYRIRAEEDMLLARLGQPYEEYRSRSQKLIPFVY